MLTDQSGRYASLYRPHHLIGLELGISVASAVLHGKPTGVTRRFLGDVVTCAKRQLAAGERLDGEGGYTVFGKLMPSQDSLAGRALPIGLATAAKVIKPVSKHQTLSYDDVELGTDSWLVQLRRQLEQERLPG